MRPSSARNISGMRRNRPAEQDSSHFPRRSGSWLERGRRRGELEHEEEVPGSRARRRGAVKDAPVAAGAEHHRQLPETLHRERPLRSHESHDLVPPATRVNRPSSKMNADKWTKRADTLITAAGSGGRPTRQGRGERWETVLTAIARCSGDSSRTAGSSIDLWQFLFWKP